MDSSSICTYHGIKNPRSVGTNELYLVTGNHEKSKGKSLISHPQWEFINLRPTSELVTQIVGACLCSQMSTEEWILHITERQKYKQQHGAAEIRAASWSDRNNRAATRSGRNNGVASWSSRNRKSLAPLFTKLQPSRRFT